jgi:hypothetical protein
MVDLSSVIQALSAVSSVAVIFGAIFVIFQLRQNAKLISATLLENKATSSIAILEKITDESFARRRKSMHDSVKEYAARNWEGFDFSLPDFEARNFAYIYELIGQLAREGVIDLKLVINALQYLVVFDWEAFAPLQKHLNEVYKVKVNPWGNFEWLAQEARKHMQERAKTLGVPD